MQKMTEQMVLKRESLHDIVCRLCFETESSAPQISVLSPFAGEQCLSDVIRTCFGVNIKEDDFCTDICEQCLVKVDLTWQFYSTINDNSKALNDLYSSVQCRDTLPDICQIMDTTPAEPTQRKRLRPKSTTANKTEHTSSDQGEHSVTSIHNEAIYNDDGSLPEHPFFANHSMCAYNCHLCPQILQSSKLLDMHLQREHALKSEKVLCQCCAKFYKPRAFYDHFRLHSDKKYDCSICNQTYTNSANLHRHMRLHTKKRPFTCNQCDASYNQSASLKKHVDKVHLGIVPPFKTKSSIGAPKHSKAARSMSCPVCEESFYMQSKLIAHLEENHPDYEVTIIRCNHCPERFLRKASYYNHRLYRHSEKDYPCDECGEVLASALHLNEHKKRHHRARHAHRGAIKDCYDDLSVE
ncbi:zinc finger protein 595-like [Ochlerotatus camptorhynchus]|uniref:zinc finger protein 595-like n=1 Tax=Ochlerotatus camptorhynchus TaxID=644619 RepID=UPI0031DA3FB4